MKILFNYIIIVGLAIIVSFGCKVNQAVANKPGVQLWAENCVRCHYVPSPTDYSDKQWDIIGTHMQVRASITDEERIKIIEFIKSAN